MIEYFDLGGKKRPVLYGMAAFRLCKQRTGRSLSKILADLTDENDPDNVLEAITDITYCALKVGEAAAGVPASERDDYDELMVAAWIDLYDGGANVFMEKLVDALPKAKAGEGESEPGEAQATGTGTSLKSQPVA